MWALQLEGKKGRSTPVTSGKKSEKNQWSKPWVFLVKSIPARRNGKLKCPEVALYPEQVKKRVRNEAGKGRGGHRGSQRTSDFT